MLEEHPKLPSWQIWTWTRAPLIQTGSGYWSIFDLEALGDITTLLLEGLNLVLALPWPCARRSQHVCRSDEL